MKKKSFINFDSDGIFTPELVYVLGFLWADGFIDNSGFHNKVRVEISTLDKESIQKVLKYTGCWNENERVRLTKHGKDSNIIRFSLSSKRFVTFLVDNDYKNKSKVQPFKIISLIPKDLIKYWMLGFFDGDGNTFPYKHQSGGTFSIAAPFDYDWSSIQEIFNQLGIKSKIVRRKVKGGRKQEFLVTKGENIKKIYDFFYKNTLDIYLKRKKDKFEKCVFSIDSRKKISWPDDDQLISMIKNEPVYKIAKRIGVSDSAVFLRCKKRGLDISKRWEGYKKFLNNSKFLKRN